MDEICALCKRPIGKFSPILNRFDLDGRPIDLCQSCIDKFLKWQQGIFARLYPTNALKKKFGK
jgi:hypothetical protein